MQLPAGPYLRAYRVHPPSMATSDLPSKDTPQAGGTVLAILVTLVLPMPYGLASAADSQRAISAATALAR